MSTMRSVTLVLALCFALAPLEGADRYTPSMRAPIISVKAATVKAKKNKTHKPRTRKPRVRNRVAR